MGSVLPAESLPTIYQDHARIVWNLLEFKRLDPHHLLPTNISVAQTPTDVFLDVPVSI